MGLRFFKRIRLSPGLTVNLSRGGASLSLGHHGRRLAAHRGHADGGSLLDALVGLAIMWVFLKVCWALTWGPAG